MSVNAQMPSINQMPVGIGESTALIQQNQPYHTYRFGDLVVYLTGMITSSVGIFTAAQISSDNESLLILFSTISTVVHIFGFFKSTGLRCFEPDRPHQYRSLHGLFFAAALIASVIGVSMATLESERLANIYIILGVVSAVGHLFGAYKSAANEFKRI